MEEIKKIVNTIKPIYIETKKEMKMSSRNMTEFFGVRLVIASKEDSKEKFLNRLISLCKIAPIKVEEDFDYEKVQECPFLISVMLENDSSQNIQN